jgi:hypothetical protein
MKASSYGLKNLEICCGTSEWTSDVTNNYEDLDELYDEALTYGVHICRHVTNGWRL